MTTTKERPTAGAGAPSDMLKNSVNNLATVLGQRALTKVSDRVTGTADRLTEYAQGGGGGLVSALTGSSKSDDESGAKPGLRGRLADVAGTVKDKVSDTIAEQTRNQVKEKVVGLAEGVKEAVGLGGGGSGKRTKLKVTNIVEEIDVGVPVGVAYDQWTRFTDFPSFMKKVERVEQISDEKLSWTAQVFWSHRTWESTIIEQVPDERIVWRSKGDKGFVDGAVTFHEVTPDLTRVLLVLEYHPRGLFEKTGNLWRAQGRRARLELKHFRRHVMTQTLLHADELQGWRGEIHDGQVVADEDQYDEEPSTEDEQAPQDQETEDQEAEDQETEDEQPEDEQPEDQQAPRGERERQTT